MGWWLSLLDLTILANLPVIKLLLPFDNDGHVILGIPWHFKHIHE